jgi:hypothetical protein
VYLHLGPGVENTAIEQGVLQFVNGMECQIRAVARSPLNVARFPRLRALALASAA